MGISPGHIQVHAGEFAQLKTAGHRALLYPKTALRGMLKAFARRVAVANQGMKKLDDMTPRRDLLSADIKSLVKNHLVILREVAESIRRQWILRLRAE